MDVFSLLIFRLESYVLRIKRIYSYIFRFFLPPVPDEDDSNGFFDKTTDNIRL